MRKTFAYYWPIVLANSYIHWFNYPFEAQCYSYVFFRIILFVLVNDMSIYSGS